MSAEEVQQRIEELLQHAGKRAEELRARYNEPDRLQALEEDIRVEKAVDLLVDSAQITVKEIDPQVEPGHEGHTLANDAGGA